ncbi:MAG TPA: phytase [Acidimicrobiia bacterium]|nr:phytase [Acidimicrobiia bacterium]
MDGATLGSFTCLPQSIRIWLDDPNPIFRMGLAASLRDPRFVVVGESAGFVPPPALDKVDVLVFDLGDEGSLGWTLPRRQRRSTRLVGLVPGGDIETVERSQCTVLARSDLTPEGFRDCLTAVAAQAPTQDRPAETTWRRLLRRKGALFVVIAALAAGAYGPTNRAEGLSGSTVSATPLIETTPVESAGDAADDVAVWINRADPAASLVIGTDKRGGLESYDLKGRRVQRLPAPAGTFNNVDARPGFPLGGQTVTLIGTAGRKMSFFRVDPATRQLQDVGARDIPNKWSEVGLCLYRSGVSGRFYAFITEPDGDVTQYELFDQGGRVDARAVRGWPIGQLAEGCVADDETGRLFVSEEKSGIWRFEAEPETSPLNRTQVDKVGPGGHVVADVEGLALVTQPGRNGFLLASSQGDNSFAVYRRGQDHAWLGRREVVDGPTADGCSATDGIEAVAANLGPDFPDGIFICQDGRNTAPGSAGRQNFKFVRLERLLDPGSIPA